MLKKVAFVFVALLVVFGGVIASRPADFAVTRSSTIAAPAEVVYAQVIDFHEWAEWSPWDKMDPAMKREYSGAPTGVGARYMWKGNPDNVGTGSMTITDLKPAEAVGIDLEFNEPFAAKNRTLFAFAPEAGGTKVTWTMTGRNDFMGKAFSLVMDMDKMVGADFEKGLATLKTRSEARAKAAAEKPAPMPEAAPTDAGAP
jgi:uncharacterized protein YndB with AHSA1/START domain